MGPDGLREDRRIVTALFVDVVGSTALTEGLDPEDAREVLGGAIALVVSEVDLLGGTVKDLAGDGVCALFGAPVAHEDDAERAVLCGLRIIDSFSRYAKEVDRTWGLTNFAARVGIETGRAVVGPHGAGSRIEYGATGDVVNTAARLEAAAEPGQVLVGAVTRSMVEDRFTWGEPRAYPLKGKRLPVEASVVRSYSPHPSRQARGAVRLVGRDAELDSIKAVLERLADGAGGAVVIVGEAGVGKSRLLAEARALFEYAHPGRLLEAGAASYATAVPHQLYRNLVLGWLDLPLNARKSEVEAAVTARARSLAARPSTALRTIGSNLVAAQLDTLDAEAAQRVLFQAYADLFDSLTSSAPLALALEDLHWADPTSLALTSRLVKLVASRQLLLFLTSRPATTSEEALEEIAATTRDRCARLDLAPLSCTAERELLHEMVGRTEVSRSVEERLLGTTDGNPFFIEELVRSILVHGGAALNDGNVSPDVDSPRALEPTVERALIARIDRLAEADRKALLAASVLGLSFDRSVLQTLVGAGALDSIRELELADFVEPVDAGRGATGSYRFRHALVQEAAYGSLLRAQRRNLHAEAAAALEIEFLGREDEIAATLGHHLAEAGQADRAVDYFTRAARRAIAAFGNVEAVTLTRAALALMPEPADATTTSQRTRMIELLDIEATALRTLARHEDAVAVLRNSLALLDPEDHLSRARVHVRLAQSLVDAHQYKLAVAELDLADAHLDGVPESDAGFRIWLDASLARGSVYYWLDDQDGYSRLIAQVQPIVEQRGTRAQLIDFLGTVRASLWRRDKFLADDELVRLDRTLFAAEHESPDEEARAWAAFHHGFTLMWHRDLDEAQHAFEESLAGAEHVGSLLLKARSLTYLMTTARLRGDVERAAALVDPVRELASEVGLPEYEAIAAAVAAWVAYRRGDHEEVRREAALALDTWSGRPNRYPIDWLACLPLLAVAVSAKSIDDATRWAQVALEPEQQRLPDLLSSQLTAGTKAVQSGDSNLGFEHFRAAVGTARDLHYL